MSKQAYQMPIRNKGGNKFKPGITGEENYGVNRFQTGVPQTGYKGIPREQGRGQFGVPIPGQGKVALPEPQTPHCTAITKKGDPCKARPITGEYLCIGHKRASG